jgi:DNA-binding HxlR family transcriptional regulator
MLNYGQFCPVAQAAQVFADRWTPLILRELCFGPCTFGELLSAMPLISRTMLAQRLKELAHAEVVAIQPKTRGRGNLYRLTSAGEDFRPMIEMLSVWGQRWAQGGIGPDDLDPALLMYGMSRQIDPSAIPSGRTVIRFEFRGLPKRCRGRGYWWYVIQRPQVDICLRDPGFEVDAVVRADLGAFTRLSLGYSGLADVFEKGEVSFDGNKPAIALLCRLMALPERPTLKQFRFAPFPAESIELRQKGPAVVAA